MCLKLFSASSMTRDMLWIILIYYFNEYFNINISERKRSLLLSLFLLIYVLSGYWALV